MQRRYLAIFGLLVVLSFVAPSYALYPAKHSFDEWLVQFKHTARAQGISEDVLTHALDGITEDEEVVRLDKKQPESKITLTRYLKNTVTDRRITMGRALMNEHRALLEPIAARYGVPANYIIALWGIETDFGNYTGSFSVIQSLATLAYEGRRAELFSKELMAALKIMQRENITTDALIGSWAGAMGNCQFMPSTYLAYAVDGDGNGTRDIWNSHADIFSSIANYLRALNWDARQSWGRTVMVPENFQASETSLKHGKTASQWRQRGLEYGARGENEKISKGSQTLYAIYPGAEDEGVYLVSENFQALLKWNRSRYFATAVGTLADAIGD